MMKYKSSKMTKVVSGFVGLAMVFGPSVASAQTIAELSKEGGAVVATGGGAVLAPENRQAMLDSGVIVYLYATPQVLYERTRNDRNRPLLQVADPLDRLTQLFQQRDPIYRSVANLIVEGRYGSAAAMAQHLEDELRAKCEL